MLSIHYCAAAILLQCCVIVNWVSSVTPSNFGFFSSGSRHCQYFVVDVVEHLRQIDAEAIVRPPPLDWMCRW